MTIHRFAMILLLTLLVTGLIVTGMWVRFFYTPIVTDKTGLIYTVPQGASITSVIDDLYHKKIINNPHFFKLLVRFSEQKKLLKAAEYRFKAGITPSMMLNQMYDGTGVVYHTFTLIPGWTFTDLRNALAAEPLLQKTLYYQTDYAIMAQLGFAEVPPEGQFYPDTYYFTAGVSDLSILKRAFSAMQDKLHSAWLMRAPNWPLQTAEQALIIASLIEKEAYLNHERPIIASVILNRLQRNMLLQIDPTVIYGLGMRYTGKLHKDDLLVDSPYNTYLHKGLPPTPIAMPSFASIMAAVQPANTDYLYFVARGDGSHQFSTNLADHNSAVFSVNRISSIFFNTALLTQYLHKGLMNGQANYH